MPGIEVPLVLNKSVKWKAHRRDLICYTSTVTKPNEALQVLPRNCSLETIPVSSDLIDALKSCRIPVNLDPEGQIKLPKILVHFAVPEPGEPDLDEVYMDIPTLDCFVSNELHENAPNNCDVSVRVDVRVLACQQNEFYMEPQFSSQFFTTRNGTDYATKMNMTAPFRAQQIYDAWFDPDLDWISILSFTLFLEPRVEDLTGLVHANSFILSNKLFSDVIVVAENGTEIDCHRNILAAQSSFFLAAFQTDMTEGRTRKVRLPGMSEESVRALLEFMYTREKLSCFRNFRVCFELLQAGHKYDILNLQRDIQDVLLDMDFEFDDDKINKEVVLELFLFSKQADLYELKRKAMEYLKWKYDELKELPMFKELPNDIKMELVDFFETAKNSADGSDEEEEDIEVIQID